MSGGRLATNEEGNRYGFLVVKGRRENDGRRQAQWLCVCDCGNRCIKQGRVLRYIVRRGGHPSCGHGCVLSRARVSAAIKVLPPEKHRRYGILVT